jgi:hypothetical protein
MHLFAKNNLLKQIIKFIISYRHKSLFEDYVKQNIIAISLSAKVLLELFFSRK